MQTLLGWWHNVHKELAQNRMSITVDNFLSQVNSMKNVHPTL